MKLKALVAILAGVAVWSCSSPTDPDRDLARAVVIISGDGQSVARGAVVPQPIVVEVQDERGRPVRHNPLYWTIDHETLGRIGTVLQAVAETDRHGRAQGTVRVDTIPGEYQVNIWAGIYERAPGDSVIVSGMARVFVN